jgi:heme-degrading monooxygenase HmoA
MQIYRFNTVSSDTGSRKSGPKANDSRSNNNRNLYAGGTTMHARVILGKVKHDKQDEAITVYRESVAPAARKQKGFKSMNLLTDRDTNKFISISYWETEADMVTGESSGYLQKQLDRITTLFVGPPTIQHYDVSF